MDKKPVIFNKMLVIGIFILFITISIIPFNCTAINEIDSDLTDEEVKKEFFNIKPSLNGNPPIMKILYPENGSTIYTRYSNIKVKCTDDIGLTYIEIEYGGDHYSIGTGHSIYPPSKIYYFNMSLSKMEAGYVWIVAKAFDEDGNIGIDTAIFYYDDSNDTDLYPPEVDIIIPRKGGIYLFGESFKHFEKLNFSVVIGKFEIFTMLDDQERHLQKVEIYIDEEVVYEKQFSNESWEFIQWDCNKRLFGMYEIKIVASDSYNNSAMEKLNCFIINFF